MVQFKYLFHRPLFSIYCLNVSWERSSKRRAGAGGICNRALNGPWFAIQYSLDIISQLIDPIAPISGNLSLALCSLLDLKLKVLLGLVFISSHNG